MADPTPSLIPLMAAEPDGSRDSMADPTPPLIQLIAVEPEGYCDAVTGVCAAPAATQDERGVPVIPETDDATQAPPASR